MSESDDGKPRGNSTALFKEIVSRLSGYFHLWDKTDRAGTIETITESIEFRGASLWGLIVAIVLASIGLNTNSIALIIGAMLISPLMGPIMGAGLALGLYDITLLKRSLLNLAIMTGISLFVSFAYFSLSPLRGTTPELLARTMPTFFDVLVALFGGTAMIIAVSRTSRSTNTIAGVAVATALMPPLCTAGYGLANRDMGIFAGAAYLYLINSVFIGFTTFFFTKYLKLGEARADKPAMSRRWVVALTVITIAFLAPSLYLAYDLIQETSFQSKVDQFVAKNMQFPDSQISTVLKKRSKPLSTIQVTVVGTPLSDEMVRHLQAQLPENGLAKTELKVIQNPVGSAQSTSAFAAPPSISPAMAGLDDKDKTIVELRQRIETLTDKNALLEQVSKEVGVLFPEVESFSWGDLLVSNATNIDPQKIYTILVKWKAGGNRATAKARLSVFLKVRLQTENLSIVAIDSNTQ
jgi:uncharacterized hydrophobic protein (TIGR00271 family)